MENEEIIPTGTSEESTLDTAPEAGEESSAQAEQVLDLDSVGKFKYGGRDWTTKELQNAIMRQEDYTRKTQSLAQERKFAENFAFDAARVMDNPKLFQQFADLYPPKYVETLKAALGDKLQTQQTNDPKSSNQLEYEARIKKLEQYFEQTQKESHDAKVQANEAMIDRFMSELKPKYKFVDEEAVLARAQSLYEKGADLTKMTTWEKIYKDVHGRTEKLFNDHYKSMFQNQKQAGSKARDTASGGGIPGQAPPKSFKEAHAVVENLIKQQRGN